LDVDLAEGKVHQTAEEGCKDRDNNDWKQPAVAITCSDRATSDLWKLKDMLPLT
jgi:hypothetical protein